MAMDSTMVGIVGNGGESGSEWTKSQKEGQEVWEHRTGTDGRGIKSMGLREQERRPDAEERGLAPRQVGHG